MWTGHLLPPCGVQRHNRSVLHFMSLKIHCFYPKQQSKQKSPSQGDDIQNKESWDVSVSWGIKRHMQTAWSSAHCHVHYYHHQIFIPFDAVKTKKNKLLPKHYNNMLFRLIKHSTVSQYCDLNIICIISRITKIKYKRHNLDTLLNICAAVLPSPVLNTHSQTLSCRLTATGIQIWKETKNVQWHIICMLYSLLSCIHARKQTAWTSQVPVVMQQLVQRCMCVSAWKRISFGYSFSPFSC